MTKPEHPLNTLVLLSMTPSPYDDQDFEPDQLSFVSLSGGGCSSPNRALGHVREPFTFCNVMSDKNDNRKALSEKARRERLEIRRQHQKIEGAVAWAEYQSRQEATMKRLVQLRVLRLARDGNSLKKK